MLESECPVGRVDDQFDQFGERYATRDVAAGHAAHTVGYEHAVAVHDVILLEQIFIEICHEILERAPESHYQKIVLITLSDKALVGKSAEVDVETRPDFIQACA